MASRRFRPADGAKGAALLRGYRIVVVASSVGAVVEAAGGFLCDRARAGWGVSVQFADACDARPLAILGVAGRHVAGPDVGSMVRELPQATTVLLDADLVDRDPDARDALARAARQACGAVRIWGRPAQAEVGTGLVEVRHEMSPAAMAFKVQALRAAGRAGIAAPVEALYQVRGESYRRLYSV